MKTEGREEERETKDRKVRMQRRRKERIKKEGRVSCKEEETM